MTMMMTIELHGMHNLSAMCWASKQCIISWHGLLIEWWCQLQVCLQARLAELRVANWVVNWCRHRLYRDLDSS